MRIWTPLISLVLSLLVLGSSIFFVILTGHSALEAYLNGQWLAWLALGAVWTATTLSLLFAGEALLRHFRGKESSYAVRAQSE